MLIVDQIMSTFLWGKIFWAIFAKSFLSLFCFCWKQPFLFRSLFVFVWSFDSGVAEASKLLSYFGSKTKVSSAEIKVTEKMSSEYESSEYEFGMFNLANVLGSFHFGTHQTKSLVHDSTKHTSCHEPDAGLKKKGWCWGLSTTNNLIHDW